MATIYTYTVQYQGVQYITSRSTSVHKSTQVFNSLCTGLVLDTVGNYYIIQIFYQVAMFVYFMAYRTILFKMDNAYKSLFFSFLILLIDFDVVALEKKING